MDQQASRPYTLLWVSIPLAAAIWRLVEWWRLSHAREWAYYLGQPAPIFWWVIVALCGAVLLWPVRQGWLRAALFIFLIVCYGLLPTQAGSMAAHPDYFLEEAIDRVNDKIRSARKQGKLPSHPIDLRKALQIEGTLHYRRGDVLNVPIQVRLHPGATGPVTDPGQQPGIIHVAIEGPKQRIWVSATGLGFARFGDPVMLPDRRGSEQVVIEHPALALLSPTKETP